MEFFIGLVVGAVVATVIAFFVFKNNKIKINEAVEALSTGENITSDDVKKIIEILKK